MADTASATTSTTASAGVPPPSNGAASGAVQKPATAPPPAESKATETGTILGGDDKVEAKGEAGKTEDQAPAEVKWPETLRIAQDVRGKFGELTKAAGLKAEHAQQLVDLVHSAQEASDKALLAELEKDRTERVATLKNDPEYGGQKFQESVSIARRAMAKFGDDALREAFRDSAYGDHPALFRLLVRVGKALGEDTVAGTTDANAKHESKEKMLRDLYPQSYTSSTKG